MIIERYFFIEPICCDPSSDPSHRDGSDEGSIIKYSFFPRALSDQFFDLKLLLGTKADIIASVSTPNKKA